MFREQVPCQKDKCKPEKNKCNPEKMRTEDYANKSAPIIPHFI